MTACKKLLCFLEILPIPGSGLPFSKILLNQPWFHPVWNSCHFRNQPGSIRCPAKRRAEDFICLNPLCKNLLCYISAFTYSALFFHSLSAKKFIIESAQFFQVNPFFSNCLFNSMTFFFASC